MPSTYYCRGAYMEMKSAGMMLLLSFLAIVPPAGAQGKSKPNIVLILVDDLGYMDVGPYNQKPYYETPNVGRLAGEGVRFTQGYAACPVCSPTRSSIMTGKYPARTHNTQYFGGGGGSTPYVAYLDTAEFTIAEALKAAGYKTGVFGKWHLGEDSAYWPEHHGFETNKGGCNMGQPNSYFSPYKNPRLTDGPAGEYLTDRLANEAAAWMETNKASPFFLYFPLYAVHNPMQPKKDLLAYYNTKHTTFQFLNDPEFDTVKNDSGWFVTARNIQNQDNYAAMVQSHDQAVGVLLDKIRSLNLDSNTIVIYTSDNGGLSTSEGQVTANSPLRAGKGWLYEGGVREPWIIKWPGVTKAGTVSDRVIISTDLYPTILEMAGLPLRPLQHADGISLANYLKNQSPLCRQAVYWHYPHPSNQKARPAGAVRLGDFKLVEWLNTKTIELYNLKDDIGEQNDLSKNPQFAVYCDLLLNKLHTWRKSVSANMPTGYVQQPTPALPVIRGCTDCASSNFNVYATQDDGSCNKVRVFPSVGARAAEKLFCSRTASGSVRITLPDVDSYNIAVYSLQGRLFLSREQCLAARTIVLDGVPSGTHLVTIIGKKTGMKAVVIP